MIKFNASTEYCKRSACDIKVTFGSLLRMETFLPNTSQCTEKKNDPHEEEVD